MKLRSIKIENMHNVTERTYHFDDLTYLHGQNGAGKSTVLQAIQLALLGYIPSTAKRAFAIFQHSKGKTMTVTAELENNGENITICRTFIGSKSTASSEVEISPEGYNIEEILNELELPVFNFSEFLSLSANQMKDWFLNYLPKSQTEVDLSAELQAEISDITSTEKDGVIKELEEEITQLTEEGFSGIELVRKINSWVKTNISAEKAVAQKLSSTLSTLIKYDDCEFMQGDIAHLEQQHSECYNQIASLQSQQNVFSMLTSAKAELERFNKMHEGENVPDKLEIARLEDMYRDYPEKEAEIKQELDSLSSNIIDLRSEMMEISTEMKGYDYMLSSEGICPFKNNRCGELANQIEEIQKKMSDLSARKAELSDMEKKLQETYTSKEKTLWEIQEKIRTIPVQISQITTYWNTRERLEDRVSQLSESAPDMDIDHTIKELTAKAASISETITKIKANAQYDQLSSVLTQDKFKSDLRLEAYKIWDRMTGPAGKIQLQLAEKPFHEMEDQVSSYLADMFNDSSLKMKFFLSDKPNSFSFGLQRNGKYISFDLLSSGEKCLYTIALLMCLVDKQSDDKLKLILIDDLLDHLDQDKAQSLFQSLYATKTSVQLVLAGVIDCKIDTANEFVVEVQ